MPGSLLPSYFLCPAILSPGVYEANTMGFRKTYMSSWLRAWAQCSEFVSLIFRLLEPRIVPNIWWYINEGVSQWQSTSCETQQVDQAELQCLSCKMETMGTHRTAERMDSGKCLCQLVPQGAGDEPLSQRGRTGQQHPLYPLPHHFSAWHENHLLPTIWSRNWACKGIQGDNLASQKGYLKTL